MHQPYKLIILVPVFDPLDAYSMSLADHLHQPGATHAVQHFQASDAANNHAGGLHAVNHGQFVPMQVSEDIFSNCKFYPYYITSSFLREHLG